MDADMEKGNADPTPSGAMASKKMTAPIIPNFKTPPLNHMETAINAWQVAIKPTTATICRLNQPLINCLYALQKVRSA